jgi:hypothetical protein
MENFVENVKDLIKNPSAWWTTIKIYITTKFMSNKQRTNVLIKAKNQSEAILTKKGLNIQFEVYLDNEEDIYFRTVAMYKMGSSEEGIIKIYIKSNLIGNEVNRVVQNILHEFSHGIYEEGFKRDLAIGHDIIKLQKYYNNINLELPQDDFIFDIHYKKEKFCELFSIYLMNEEMFSKDKEEIGNICQNIIQRFNQIHAPDKNWRRPKIVRNKNL